MTPRITITYMALSRSGRVVETADSPAGLLAIIERKAAQGVHLEPAVETTTRRAYLPQREETSIVNLAIRRGK